MCAHKHKFSEEKIRKEFDAAINNPKFKNFEQIGIIDAELKQQLVKNRDVILHCTKYKHDKLHKIEEIVVDKIGVASAAAISVIPMLAGGLVGGIIGGVADIVVKPFKKDHKIGNYAAKGAAGGALVLMAVPATLLLGITKGASVAIQAGTIAIEKGSDKNYSRYQLASSQGFSSKHTLMEVQEIPLFVEYRQERNSTLQFDHHLLSLASSKYAIVLFIESTKKVTPPNITYSGANIYVINMSWQEDVYCSKIFYCLYCIANVIIWKDNVVESKEFTSFQKILQCAVPDTICPNQHKLMQFEGNPNYICDGCSKQCKNKEILYSCRKCDFDLCEICHSATYRKPRFLYIWFCKSTLNDEPELFDMIQYGSFGSLYRSKMFSSISGYKVASSMSDKHFKIFVNIITESAKTGPRFVKFPFKCEYEKIYDCVACSKSINVEYLITKSLTQCIHCGELNFDQIHNNEYSFYRHLMYVNRYNELS
eukprot:525789_1